MSSPSRREYGCGSTRVTINRSPRSPLVCCPFPLMRTRLPSFTPARIFTSIVSSFPSREICSGSGITRAAGGRSITRLRADPGVTELIVLPALGVVRQHVIRLLHFLELPLHLRIVLMDVRVVLANQLAVRLADLLRAGGAGDAENFVI